MPILASELKFYKSQTVSDSAGNGGRMSDDAIPSGAVGNLFQAVGESERTAGSLKYRKLFCKNANDDQLTLTFPKIFLDKYTPGDDLVTFFAGTHTNTQAAITGSEKEYGCGKLDQNAIVGATDVDVLVEDSGDHPFEDGDKIRISDLFNVADLSGTEEFVTIVGAPTVVGGDVINIVFAPALVNGYSASDTRVMNVYEPADVVAEVGYPELTSAAGTFNPANLLANNIGGIEQVWTLTWTSATTFNIVGDTVGAQGAGSIGAGAAPNNPDFGKPFWTIQAAGFGGVFVAGDTLVFETTPASVPIWEKRVVPAGAAALSPNASLLQFRGETA